MPVVLLGISAKSLFAEPGYTCHPDDPPVNTQRSSVFCGSCTRLEHSSVHAKKCSVTYNNVPAPTQNRTV